MIPIFDFSIWFPFLVPIFDPYPPIRCGETFIGKCPRFRCSGEWAACSPGTRSPQRRRPTGDCPSAMGTAKPHRCCIYYGFFRFRYEKRSVLSGTNGQNKGFLRFRYNEGSVLCVAGGQNKGFFRFRFNERSVFFVAGGQNKR